MKIAFLILVVIVAAAASLWLARRSRPQGSAEHPGQVRARPDPSEAYVGLRNMMLQGSRAKFNLPAPAKPSEPWGVIMDWGLERGIATVVAMSDGSASVYLSGGGGYIGGVGQEPIRAAAKRAVEVARTVQLPAEPTTDFRLPETGGVFFYFRTDAGVFAFRTRTQEVRSPAHPLRKIGDAMQEVITQYRLWDQGGRKGGGGQLVPPDRHD